MRPIFTLLAGAAIFFISCSPSHKVAQNSDDPYYSPGSSKSGAASSAQGDYYSTAPSDQYVRMKTVDQERWSTFDDYNDYDSYYAPTPLGASYAVGYSPYYSPYSFGYGYGFPGMSIGLGFWDPYFGWNSYFLWNSCYNPYFYNPYYGGSVFIVKNNGVSVPASGAMVNHLTAFSPATYLRNGYANPSNRFSRPGVTTYSSSPYSNGSGRRFSDNSFSRPGNSGGGIFGNGGGSFSQPRSSGMGGMGAGGSFGGGASRGGGGRH